MRTRGRALGLALLAALGCSEPEPARPSAVLITLDTTRADALGCYGGRAGVTPSLDRLARESVVYEAARTVAPLTQPAHASMLTGLYPPRHGLRDNGLRALPASASTLAEQASAAGAATAAVVASVVLDASFGLAQGFDAYGVAPGSEGSAATERRADDVARAACDWIRSRDRSKPFFLWVHFFDPHDPYDPPAAFRETGGGNAYLGEVAAMDAGVGRVLDALAEEGLLGTTWIVVAGDHGESLGEHGEPTHSIFCYESTIRVPLIVRHPDGSRAGERSREIASVADVHPTLLAALGLGAAPGVDGRSLLEPVPADRGVYFESYCGYIDFGWSPIAGWADARGKYMHSATPELFDPTSDPHERSNRIDGADVEPYREAIADVASRPALAAESPAVDEALLASLRSLGYAAAGDTGSELPLPLDDTGLPSPRERRGELRAFYRATTLLGGAERDEGLRLLAEIADLNPRNAFALQLLGAGLIEQGRDAEARAVLERHVALGHRRPTVLIDLGRVCERLGDLGAAAQHYRDAASANPHSGAAELLARVLEASGRTDEAAAVRASIERSR